MARQKNPVHRGKRFIESTYDQIKWISDNMAYVPYNDYKGDCMADFKLIAYEKENGEVVCKRQKKRFHRKGDEG